MAKESKENAVGTKKVTLAAINAYAKKLAEQLPDGVLYSQSPSLAVAVVEWLGLQTILRERRGNRKEIERILDLARITAFFNNESLGS